MSHEQEAEKYYVLFSTKRRRPSDRELEALHEKTGGQMVRIAQDLVKAYPPPDVNKEEWVSYCAAQLDKIDLYKVLGVTAGTGIISRPMSNDN